MRRSAQLLACVVIALPGAARGQAKPASADSAAIVRLEDGWADALVKRDKAYFSKTLAAGFVYTEGAATSTRDEVLRDIVVPDDTVTLSKNEQMTVHMFGNSTAVVTGLLVIDGRAKGTRYDHRYKFTDTWVKQPDGRWQIVAAQDYLVGR